MALSRILARILREISEPAERTSGTARAYLVGRTAGRPGVRPILTPVFGRFKIYLQRM